TTPEALLQRVPPMPRVRERAVTVTAGQTLDADWLRDTLLAFGYGFDDRVDEPGEAAIRGGTIDIHPAGANAPLRLELDDGRVVAIRQFDPASQRSLADVQTALLLPTTEAFTVPGESLPDSPAEAREQLLPDGDLATIFDYLPGAAFALTEGAEDRLDIWAGLIQDSFQAARTAGTANLLPPDRLYLPSPELARHLDNHAIIRVTCGDAAGEPPLAASVVPRRVSQARAAGDAVVLCGDAPADRLQAALTRRLRPEVEQIAILPDWPAARNLPPRAVGVLRLPLSQGFAIPGITVLALRASARPVDETVFEQLAGSLNIGDLVVDRERGLARLEGLAMEEQAGAPVECLRLAFLGGTNLLLPATEAGRIWRYGASPVLKPDRLDSAAWQARRQQIEQEIDATAAALVRRIRARAQRKAPMLERGADYRRFLHRMPYAATPDQARAIRAVQQDLVAGRPMYRLVCGDVGFGKTEVALHAAAIAAMAGKQVAVAAPTTILARQHFET
ncbi:MAG TPA: DEAD/DEAH box helicase, partial [Rhodopila sp.]|nr:DEAD/DEAH box helicase [Rhodopila sp.]